MVIIILFVGALACIGFFNRVGDQRYENALDWKMFWAATHNFQIDYAGKWIFNPPWCLMLLWPASLLPVYAGWGLVAFLSLMLVALAVPRSLPMPRWLVGLIAAVVSYPTLRQISDGNLEFLVLAGVLALHFALERQQPWALAAACLLLTSKIQESWLLLAFAGWVALRTWLRPKWMQAGGLALLLVAPSLLWKGAEWLESLGRFPAASPHNSSLLPTLARLGAPGWLGWVLWALVLAATAWVAYRERPSTPWEVYGLLVIAAMLLAPYSGNSMLLPLALGVIPLLARKPWWVLPLILIYSLPVLGSPAFHQNWEYTYFCGVLVITWVASILTLLSSPAPATATDTPPSAFPIIESGLQLQEGSWYKKQKGPWRRRDT